MNKIDLCNLALSLIGNKTITDIESPTTAEEKICKIWYEKTLKQALIEASPNFARARANIPLSNYTNPFGFTYAYKIPNNCLKVVGIGEVEETHNSYCVEGDYILTDITLNNALPIRYINYITDTTKFSQGFIDYFIHILATNICYQINKDSNLKQYLQQVAQQKLLNTNTVDNQESKIVIVSNSRYYQSRFGGTINKYQK